MLENLNEILGIVGFVITVITLILALRIQKKMKKTTDKQQFLRDKDSTVKELNEFSVVINENKILYNDIQVILRKIQATMEQIIILDIWNRSDKKIMKAFINLTTECINEMDSYSYNPLTAKSQNETSKAARLCVYNYINSEIENGNKLCVRKFHNECDGCESENRLCMPDSDSVNTNCNKSSRYHDLENTITTYTFQNTYYTKFVQVLAIIKTESRTV